jgi:hypothetical protein
MRFFKNKLSLLLVVLLFALAYPYWLAFAVKVYPINEAKVFLNYPIVNSVSYSIGNNEINCDRSSLEFSKPSYILLNNNYAILERSSKMVSVSLADYKLSHNSYTIHSMQYVLPDSRMILLNLTNNNDIDYSLNKSKEFSIPALDDKYYETVLDNGTEKLGWYVQEKPQCSNIILFAPEQLEGMGVKINDFRYMGQDVGVCLACDICPADYLLILTNDKQSKSILLGLGFKEVDDISKYP